MGGSDITATAFHEEISGQTVEPGGTSGNGTNVKFKEVDGRWAVRNACMAKIRKEMYITICIPPFEASVVF